MIDLRMSAALPLDLREVEEFSEMIGDECPGFAFDPAYIALLSVHNGGAPIKRHFLVDGHSYPIDYFLCFCAAGDTGIDVNIRRSTVDAVWSNVEDRLSPGLIPFATTPSGDLLCFAHRKGVRPQVVLWDHERSEEGSPYTRFVASDFDSFCGALH